MSRIKALLAAGSDVNATANDGRTALMTAAAYCMTESVKALLEAGAQMDARDNRGWTALMFAARSVTALGDMGPNGKFILAPGRSAKESAAALLGAGADPKATDNEQAAALMKATDEEVIRLLVARGTEVNAKDRDGRAALMHVASSQVPGPSMVKPLIGVGAQVNARDNGGKTAMRPKL